MHLDCIFVFLATQFDFWFVVEHVLGKTNSLANNLSHDNLHHLFSQVPQSEYNKPSQVSQSLLDLLGYNHHIWTFTAWIRLFGNTIQQL